MSFRSLGVAAAWLLPLCAVATTLGPQGLVERVRASDRVVMARVLETRTELPDGNPRRMFTVTALDVQDEYKGKGARRLELMQLGGKHGLWESRIPGDASFEAGETAVLFLRCRDPKAPARCVLVGLSEGKLPVSQDGSGRKHVALRRRDGTESRRPLESVVSEIHQVDKGQAPAPAGKVTR
jgi:hypothetical protein